MSSIAFWLPYALTALAVIAGLDSLPAAGAMVGLLFGIPFIFRRIAIKHSSVKQYAFYSTYMSCLMFMASPLIHGTLGTVVIGVIALVVDTIPTISHFINQYVLGDSSLSSFLNFVQYYYSNAFPYFLESGMQVAPIIFCIFAVIGIPCAVYLIRRFDHKTDQEFCSLVEIYLSKKGYRSENEDYTGEIHLNNQTSSFFSINTEQRKIYIFQNFKEYILNPEDIKHLGRSGGIGHAWDGAVIITNLKGQEKITISLNPRKSMSQYDDMRAFCGCTRITSPPPTYSEQVTTAPSII